MTGNASRIYSNSTWLSTRADPNDLNGPLTHVIPLTGRDPTKALPPRQHTKAAALLAAVVRTSEGVTVSGTLSTVVR